MKSRCTALREIDGAKFDVCVIGGGATGAGCALDAQLRGLSTVLIEAGDFACATSSSSTKLIHGGVRYLERAIWNHDAGQYLVVKRALRERKRMLGNAPFLARPVEILVPCFSRRELYYFWIGMKLYDWLSGRNALSPSRRLSTRETLLRSPMLKPDNLTGTIAYTDGQFDDARYNIALIRTISECGGEVLNYAQVLGFGKDSKGRLAEAQVRDEQTGRHFTVRARAFVNATGPFADHIRALATPGVASRLRLSKGSHILLPLDVIACKDALLVPKTDDGRVVFVIPWLGRLLVGTTDDESSLREEVTVTRAEAEYLLRHLNRYLVRPFTVDQIVSGFAGVRPLLASGSARSTKDLARDHEVEVDHSSGLISVLGGKWTTYRAMAEDAIDAVQRYLGIAVSPCKTSHHVLSGSDAWEPNFWTILVRHYGVSTGTARHLSDKFGAAASDVLALANENPQLKQPIVENLPAIRAEVTYSVRREMAMSIEDVLARRLGVQLFSCEDAIRCAPAVGSLLAREFGWPIARQEEEVGKYIGKIAHLMQWMGLRPLETFVDADQQEKSNQIASNKQSI